MLTELCRHKDKISYGVGAFFGLQLQIEMEESQYISQIHSGANVKDSKKISIFVVVLIHVCLRY